MKIKQLSCKCFGLVKYIVYISVKIFHRYIGIFA